MSTIQDMQTVVTQLAAMGADLVKSITPIAIGAAKLSALSSLISDLIPWAMMLICFICVIFNIFFALWFDRKEAYGFSATAGFCFFLSAIGFLISVILAVLNISNTVIDLYGYHHPDVYLAYQTYNKIVGN